MVSLQKRQQFTTHFQKLDKAMKEIRNRKLRISKLKLENFKWQKVQINAKLCSMKRPMKQINPERIRGKVKKTAKIHKMKCKKGNATLIQEKPKEMFKRLLHANLWKQI